MVVVRNMLLCHDGGISFRGYWIVIIVRLYGHGEIFGDAVFIHFKIATITTITLIAPIVVTIPYIGRFRWLFGQPNYSGRRQCRIISERRVGVVPNIDIVSVIIELAVIIIIIIYVDVCFDPLPFHTHSCHLTEMLLWQLSSTTGVCVYILYFRCVILLIVAK